MIDTLKMDDAMIWHKNTVLDEPHYETDVNCY